jgi:formylglycine-generating enzyme required for sulfatase activity
VITRTRLMNSSLALLVVWGLIVLPVQADEVPGLSSTAPQGQRSVKTDQGFMVSYVGTIPGTKITFEMKPIPAGTFALGSPESEAERGDDEGPQRQVRVAPFWMGKCEISWAEYHAYMATYEVFKCLSDLRGDAERLKSLAATRKYLELESRVVDSNTSPTPPDD